MFDKEALQRSIWDIINRVTLAGNGWRDGAISSSELALEVASLNLSLAVLAQAEQQEEDRRNCGEHLEQ